jgi:hypothetical protein
MCSHVKGKSENCNKSYPNAIQISYEIGVILYFRNTIFCYNNIVTNSKGMGKRNKYLNPGT